MKSLRLKILIALILTLLILIVGVIGFKQIMDLNWIDAIYMTAITITTVGYREIVTPTEGAKIFITVIIFSSVLIFGFALSVLTEYFISFSSIEDLKYKRKLKKIKNMKNHTIICGFGRNGQQAVKKLKEYDKDFVVIDKNKELLESSDLEPNQFLIGNANENDILLKAGIENASNLISTLPNDADNVFVVLSARQLNNGIKIISRASEDTSVKKLELAGADNVILPDKIGGRHMASLIVNPDLLEFWEILSYGDYKGVNLEQISFEQLFDKEKTYQLQELDIRQKTGCTIIGFKSPSGEYIVNPKPDTEFTENSTIIVIGNFEQIKNLQKAYSID